MFSLLSVANEVGDGYICLHNACPIMKMLEDEVWVTADSYYPCILYLWTCLLITFNLPAPKSILCHFDGQLQTWAEQWEMWVTRGHVHSWWAAKRDPQIVTRGWMGTRKGSADKCENVQLWTIWPGFRFRLQHHRGTALGKLLNASERCSLQSKENRMY